MQTLHQEHGVTTMHMIRLAYNYVIFSVTMHVCVCLISSFVTHKKSYSQEVLLIVYCDQQSVSQVIRTITGLLEKKAIAISFVHYELVKKRRRPW